MHSVKTRQQTKEHTRQGLIQTAYRLFCELGIAKTRIADVAQGAGVAHGTVFMHFPSRSHLISEVVRFYTGGIARELHDTVKGRVSVREVLSRHLEALSRHEALYARLVAEGSSLPSIARTTLLGIHSAVSTHLAKVVELEIAEGKIRRVSPALMFNTWLGLVHHYVSNRDLFAPGESVLVRWGPVLLDHYLNLLKKEN